MTALPHATETRRHGDETNKESPCLCASVARLGERSGMWLAVAIVIGSPLSFSAQQLLDRVVARVNNVAITLSDVNAAIAMGIVEAAGGDRQAVATERLIDRQLVLAEVARFAPPEPDMAAIDREVTAMQARAGARLDEVMKQTGLDQPRLRDIARDTLRIQAYLNQRFGVTVQVSDDEVSRYYQAHQQEFTRDGAVIPFAEAEPAARQRAAIARRDATIAQWMSDLRERAGVARAPTDH